jgi:hypothetical protein|tara:strand:- start:19 stop:2712 length:2694 start_codon:yes stop_codon:yes gene_type:complete
MFVYKKLKASDIAVVPFNAHKQYDHNLKGYSDSTNHIYFITASWSQSAVDKYEAANIGHTQLEHLFYEDYPSDLANKFGNINFIKHHRQLDEEVYIYSIPQLNYGVQIKPKSLQLETITHVENFYNETELPLGNRIELTARFIDDGLGNIFHLESAEGSGSQAFTTESFPNPQTYNHKEIFKDDRIFYLNPINSYKYINLSHDKHGNKIQNLQTHSIAPIFSETGPIVVDKYYPLYITPAGANNHVGGNGTHHTHRLGGVKYFMPNGLTIGVDQFHGDYQNEFHPTSLPRFDAEGCVIPTYSQEDVYDDSYYYGLVDYNNIRFSKYTMFPNYRNFDQSTLSEKDYETYTDFTKVTFMDFHHAFPQTLIKKERNDSTRGGSYLQLPHNEKYNFNTTDDFAINFNLKLAPYYLNQPGFTTPVTNATPPPTIPGTTATGTIDFEEPGIGSYYSTLSGQTIILTSADGTVHTFTLTYSSNLDAICNDLVQQINNHPDFNASDTTPAQNRKGYQITITTVATGASANNPIQGSALSLPGDLVSVSPVAVGLSGGTNASQGVGTNRKDPFDASNAYVYNEAIGDDTDSPKYYIIGKSLTRTVVASSLEGKSTEFLNTNISGSNQEVDIPLNVQRYPFEVFLTPDIGAGNNYTYDLHFRRSDGNKTHTAIVTGLSANPLNEPIYNITCQYVQDTNQNLNLEVWIDGTKQASVTEDYPIGCSTCGKDAGITQNNANVYIGCQGGIQHFLTGSLQNISIYQRALKDEEIIEHNHESKYIGTPIVGNIFYNMGLITITNPYYFNHFKNPNITSSIRYKNTMPLTENEYQITVDEQEYNYTNNVTTRCIQNEEGEQLANFATGSLWKPYVTTVGLYNEDHELLVVGKLGQPTKMSDETDTTFVLRWDT